MGWAARANHVRTMRERNEADLRTLLQQFPDRSTYERWLTDYDVDDQHRSHLEAFLPAHLRVQGTV